MWGTRPRPDAPNVRRSPTQSGRCGSEGREMARRSSVSAHACVCVCVCVRACARVECVREHAYVSVHACVHLHACVLLRERWTPGSQTVDSESHYVSRGVEYVSDE